MISHKWGWPPTIVRDPVVGKPSDHRGDRLGAVALDDLTITATAKLTAAGVEPETPSMRQTLRAPLRLTTDAVARLRAIQAGRERSLDVSSAIGEGGMGVVLSGVQRSLGREVALKTVRPTLRHDEASGFLVREAILTGRLEHPNIVPVHDLTVGDDDAPVLVMKRIAGTTWAEVLEKQAASRRPGQSAWSLDAESSDALEWNLRTLMSVCQAVHFAHSRNIVHRDLKPTNVMVGDFGEVYLVDWGIAFELDDGTANDGPMVGTPAYMAPEMLLGETIDVRTDVYQLGGVLFEILVGRAPHDVQGSTSEVIKSVLASMPALPSTLPEELATLILRCMHRDPEKRPESAEAVRSALASFLRHRGSVQLALRAHERELDLGRMLAKPAVDLAAIQRVYGEIMFGFRAAREAWPGNDTARAGLARATRALVHFELERGMVESARNRLAELEEPDAELAADVARASEEADARARRDARIVTENDPKTGRRGRLVVIVSMGTLWAAQPIAQQLGWLGRGAETHLGGALGAAASIALLSPLVFLFRRDVMRSRLNRQLAGVALVVLVSQMLAYGGAAILGIGAATTQTLLLFVWFFGCAVLGVTMEAAFLAPSLAFLVAFLVAARSPPLRLYAEAGANLVIGASALLIRGGFPRLRSDR